MSYFGGQMPFFPIVWISIKTFFLRQLNKRFTKQSFTAVLIFCMKSGLIAFIDDFSKMTV